MPLGTYGYGISEAHGESGAVTTTTSVAEKLRDLIASSASFQSAVGVGSEAAALAYVYIQGRTASSGVFSRPYALVEGLRTSNRFSATSGYQSGRIRFKIERDVASGDAANHETAALNFIKWVEDVLGDMMLNQHDGLGRLILSNMTTDEPQRSSFKEAGGQGDYYRVWVTVDYGIGA
jgi:hypothetical protein